MQSFVKDRGRPASPQHHQNAPAGVSARRQAAANTKVPTKRGALAQEIQAHSAIPSRGLSHVHNSSAVDHRHAQRQPLEQDQRHRQDQYDTDAASLDTTTNPSIVKVEKILPKVSQLHRHDQIISHNEKSEQHEDESQGDEGQSGYYEITEEGLDALEQAEIMHIAEQKQLEYLAKHFPAGFRFVKGDSYPPTTDGHATEIEDNQGQPFGDDGHSDQVSPSPQRPILHAQPSRTVMLQPIKQEPFSHESETAGDIQGQTDLFQKSAKIRVQDRSFAHQARPRGPLQHAVTEPPPSQPPSYSQSNPGLASKSLVLHREGLQGHANRPLTRVQFQMQPNSLQSKGEPIIQPQPLQQVPNEAANIASVIDYDPASLFAMDYAQLKNEDFDENPHAYEQPLTREAIGKPLVERLEFAQKNLEAERQSTFFSSLATREWEDAGDWFLDQFQSIIQRTKEARQQKRKLAQEFENEVEKRHMHVSKKQFQVQQAMDRMKVQGEGLVPKSPRPSNSPRPKRG